jgi:hypothetical protein
MTNAEAIQVLTRHVRECGMLMPIDWVQSNGNDSAFMNAIMLAIKALKEAAAND